MSQEVDIRKELKRLEGMIKEREVSTLRAAKTLLEDLSKYRSGQETEFPYPAFMGLIFAYLRPRLVLIVGSLMAAIFTFVQVYILFKQNELIDLQNKYVQEQTISAKQQAVSMIVSRIDPKNPVASEIALGELSGLDGDEADLLLRLANSHIPELRSMTLSHMFANKTKYQPEVLLELLSLTTDQLSYDFVNFATQSSNVISESATTAKYETNISAEVLSAEAQSLFKTSLELIASYDNKERKPQLSDKLNSVVENFYSYIAWEYGWDKVIEGSQLTDTPVKDDFYKAVKYIDFLFTDFCSSESTAFHPEHPSKTGIKFYTPNYDSENTLGRNAKSFERLKIDCNWLNAYGLE